MTSSTLHHRVTASLCHCAIVPCRPGFYDFNWVTSESSSTPLLDVQVLPGLKFFNGVRRKALPTENLRKDAAGMLRLPTENVCEETAELLHIPLGAGEGGGGEATHQ